MQNKETTNAANSDSNDKAINTEGQEEETLFIDKLRALLRSDDEKTKHAIKVMINQAYRNLNL